MLSDEERKVMDSLKVISEYAGDNYLAKEHRRKLKLLIELVEKQSKEIEELKEESKEYQIGFAQGCYEKDLDWEDKIKAKIEELDEKIKVKKEIAKNPMDRVSGRLLTDNIVELEKTKKVLQSLLEKE